METGRKGSPVKGNGPEKGKFVPPTIGDLTFPSQTPIDYTTWILIHTMAGDTGARPLPGGTVFWESPDVWVVSTLGVNQPVVGQPNTVFARVTNLGWEYAAGVIVKFYWADPAVAITGSTAVPIGWGWADIPSGWSVVVQCPTPWVPVLENGGHECLIAEAYIPVLDPVTAAFDPMDDRHVGQKNEQLVTVGAGQSFNVKIKAVNALPLPLEVKIEVQPVRPTEVPPLLAAHTTVFFGKLKPPSSTLPLSMKFSDAPPVYTGSSEILARRLLAQAKQEAAGTAVDTSVSAQISRSVAFEPWESRAIEISGQVPSNAKPGDTYMFRIVQKVGSMVAGGYTVSIVVVDR